MQPAACTPFRGKVNASKRESLILNRPANGSAMQALIIQWFAVNGGSDDVHTENCQDDGEISTFAAQHFANSFGAAKESPEV